jgi:hypothetical protein
MKMMALQTCIYCGKNEDDDGVGYIDPDTKVCQKCAETKGPIVT